MLNKKIKDQFKKTSISSSDKEIDAAINSLVSNLDGAMKRCKSVGLYEHEAVQSDDLKHRAFILAGHNTKSEDILKMESFAKLHKKAEQLNICVELGKENLLYYPDLVLPSVVIKFGSEDKYSASTYAYAYKDGFKEQLEPKKKTVISKLLGR